MLHLAAVLMKNRAAHGYGIASAQMKSTHWSLVIFIIYGYTYSYISQKPNQDGPKSEGYQDPLLQGRSCSVIRN